jgi:hypothetical protein
LEEKIMAAETKGEKRERVGQLRCPNCFERFHPAPGADRATCSHCNWEWYISWSGKLAKIRKPVWESWEKLVAETQPEEQG